MADEIPEAFDSQDMEVTVHESPWSYPGKPGIYKGEITAVDTYEGQYGRVVRLTYSIEHEGVTYKIPDYLPYHEEIGIKTKMYKRLIKLLGKKTLDGMHINLNDLVGKRVTVTVSVVIRDDHEYLKITDVSGDTND